MNTKIVLTQKTPCVMTIICTMSILLGTALCCNQSSRMNKDARLVSADEFKKVYDFDRTALSHADYLGKKDGFHYIAVFHPGDGSRAQYQYSIRARGRTTT